VNFNQAENINRASKGRVTHGECEQVYIFRPLALRSRKTTQVAAARPPGTRETRDKSENRAHPDKGIKDEKHGHKNTHPTAPI
jgi:hypothetical protein